MFVGKDLIKEADPISSMHSLSPMHLYHPKLSCCHPRSWLAFSLSLVHSFPSPLSSPTSFMTSWATMIAISFLLIFSSSSSFFLLHPNHMLPALNVKEDIDVVTVQYSVWCCSCQKREFVVRSCSSWMMSNQWRMNGSTSDVTTEGGILFTAELQSLKRRKRWLWSASGSGDSFRECISPALFSLCTKTSFLSCPSSFIFLSRRRDGRKSRPIVGALISPFTTPRRQLLEGNKSFSHFSWWGWRSTIHAWLLFTHHLFLPLSS